jgi:hypothetical protein
MGIMDTSITIRQTIVITAPPDVVWDLTQDFGRRRDWEPGIEAAELLASDPRRVRVRLKDTGSVTIAYRLERRPVRTSLAFEDVDSRWIRGGGGSWEYEPVEGGTRWTRTDTLVLRNRLIAVLFGGLIRRRFVAGTDQAMARAKALIER